MRKTMVVQGHLIASTQATIKTAIEDLEQAYKMQAGGDNGGIEGWRLDAGLYHDDGTQSAHFLDASDAINGVRLKSLTWNVKDGAEYATGRNYTIVLEADYMNVEDQIYDFSETVQFIGNTGPRWELVTQCYGPPLPNIIADQTPQTIIQAGTATGISAWPYIPGELLPWEYKHGDMSYWEYGSPEVIGRNGKMMYPIRWRYVFSSIAKQDFRPHSDFPGH